MMEQELTLVYEHETTDAIGVWELLACHLAENNLSEDEYQVIDEVAPFKEVAELLKRRAKPHFGIKGKIFAFDLAIVGACCHDAIRISGGSKTNWDDWVVRLQEAGKFVQAFLIDKEYDFWQNAEDPLQYQARDRGFEHLPMISNGLPFPLEQKIIDTSNNPGHWVLREGYIEAIASPMWLGERFWKLTGSDKQAVETDGIEVEEVNGLTRIVAAEQPFTESTDVPMQKRLRSALFPKCASV